MARILVDLDGVVVNYDFPKALKEVLDFEIESNEDITTYDLTAALGIPSTAVGFLFYTLNKKRLEKEELIEGAQSTLTALAVDHRIVINTKRLKYCSMQTLREWLVKNKIPYHAIVMDKVSLVCDYQIDDNVSKLVENPDAKTRLLFSQPWNLGCKDVGRLLHRVRSWAEIRQIIKEETKRDAPE